MSLGDPPVGVAAFLLAAQFPGMTHGDALGDAAAYAVAAERAGMSGVWIAEHHFISYGTCPSAPAFAANILGRTERIEVGTAACVLSARHPVALAEEAALLDHLSGGRFRLGVGRGGPWLELEVFGTGLPRYQHGFAESLDLLLDGLGGRDRVGAAGAFFRFREVPVVPRPRMPLRPWVAATSPATVDLAADRGLPLLLGMHEDDAGKAAMLARYAARARTAGRDPAAVPHAAAVVTYVADSRAAALGDLRAAMPDWMRRGVGDYVRIDGSSGPRRDLGQYVEHLLRIHPVGTPQQCAARLARTVQRTGVRRLLLMVEGAGDRDHTLHNIARIGAEVLPLLDDSLASAPWASARE